jgi:hypothetical protein
VTDGVSFELMDAKTKMPAPFDLYYLMVFEHQSDDEWRLVWDIAGRSRISTVRYGEVPAGSSERVADSPLARAKTYRVTASGRYPSEPAGTTTRYFAFDQNGKVVGVERPGRVK